MNNSAKYFREIFNIASKHNNTKRLTRLVLLAIIAFGAVLGGCRPLPPPAGRVKILSAHNNNANRIKALWAVADVEISFSPLGPIGKVRLTDGRLYYRQNTENPAAAPYFMLRAMEAGVEVFQLGTNPEAGEFYCWSAPPNQQPWAIVGKLENLHAIESDTLATIDPINLAAAIGIVPWPTDPAYQQQAIIKTCEDPDIYRVMVVGNVDSWGGWSLLREEWIDRYDTELLRPHEVHIFDKFGNDAMHAVINSYAGVEVAGFEPENWPFMANDITVYPPEATGVNSLRLRISNPTTGNAEQTPPPARAFKTRIPPYIKDIRIAEPGK